MLNEEGVSKGGSISPSKVYGALSMEDEEMN